MDFADVQHSVFLQALGSAIINSLWQGMILWLLYELLAVSYRNASAKFKNNLATFFLFISFIGFLTGFISGILHPATPTAGIATSAAYTSSMNHTVSPAHEFLVYAGSALPYLSVAYMLLLFFLMVKLLVAYRYVYLISKKQLELPPSTLQVFADKVAGQLGIPRRITVWISHRIDVPATIGFLKPMILVPFASLNNLSGEQLEAIILHEISHIRRNDYLVNMIVSVIETILFFNPFVALLSRVIKRERENCCDDFVLQYRYDPHSYAYALLQLEQSRIHKPGLAMGAVSGKKQLLSRIKRITNGEVAPGQFNYGQKLLSLLLVTGILCSVAWLSPGGKAIVQQGVVVKKDVLSPRVKPSLPGPALKMKEDQEIIFKDRTQKSHVPHKESIISWETDEADLIPKEAYPQIPGDLATSNEKIFPGKKQQQPYFAFDPGQANLPASIRLKHLPSSGKSFTIDLFNLDQGRLNENLQHAFEGINSIDWAQLEGTIRENLSRIRIDDLPAGKQLEFYVQKAADLNKKRAIIGQHSAKFLEETIKNAMRSLDSSRNESMGSLIGNNAQIQLELQALQQEFEINRDEHTTFTYSINNQNTKESGEKTIRIQGKENQGPSTKNLKISVKVLQRDH